MRTLLVGTTEGVCAGVGEAVTDSTGDIKGETGSSDAAERAGVGDSCAKAAEARKVVRIAVLLFVVMSSGVATSLKVQATHRRTARDSSQPPHKATAGQATSLR